MRCSQRHFRGDKGTPEYLDPTHALGTVTTQRHTLTSVITGTLSTGTLEEEEEVEKGVRFIFPEEEEEEEEEEEAVRLEDVEAVRLGVAVLGRTRTRQDPSPQTTAIRPRKFKLFSYVSRSLSALSFPPSKSPFRALNGVQLLHTAFHTGPLKGKPTQYSRVAFVSELGIGKIFFVLLISTVVSAIESESRVDD
jgi:hypothetical protein